MPDLDGVTIPAAAQPLRGSTLEEAIEEALVVYRKRKGEVIYHQAGDPIDEDDPLPEIDISDSSLVVDASTIKMILVEVAEFIGDLRLTGRLRQRGSIILGDVEELRDALS